MGKRRQKRRNDEYQREPEEALGYAINNATPGSLAIAEFEAATARAAQEPASEVSPEAAEVGGAADKEPKE